MSRLALLLTALALSSTASAWDCEVQSAVVCADGKCGTASSNIRITLDTGKSTVFRCDSKGCDGIEVEMFTSGMMLNAVSGKSGYLIKINTTDGTFIEVATQVTAAYIKSGICKK